MPLRTPKDFFDLALHYCSRRETSVAKMRAYLRRKFKQWHPELFLNSSNENSPEWSQYMEEAIRRLVDMGILKDDRYAEILVREYQRRGKGAHYVKNQLIQKGLADQARDYHPDQNQELEQAQAWIQKLMTRPRFKQIQNPYELKTKLFQKLSALGFDSAISKKAVESILLTLRS